MSAPEYRSSAVRPLECFSRSWDLIREQYWVFFLVLLINVVVNSIVPLVLIGPLYVGSYLCYRERSLGRETSLATLGKGFDSFLPSLVAMAIQVGISLVAMGPILGIWFLFLVATGVASGGEEEPLLAALLIGYIPFLSAILLVSLAVSVFLAFPFQLIADKGLSGPESIRASFRAARANFWGLTGLVLLNWLLLTVASICCFFPLFFYAPIWFGTMWVAYRQVFPAGPEEAAA